MSEKSLQELKNELAWLESTPIYIDKEGYPSLTFLFLILFIPYGIIGFLVYKHFKKKQLREKINDTLPHPISR